MYVVRVNLSRPVQVKGKGDRARRRYLFSMAGGFFRLDECVVGEREYLCL